MYLFASAGLYCTHQDISPEYASILLVCTLELISYKETCVDSYACF